MYERAKLIVILIAIPLFDFPFFISCQTIPIDSKKGFPRNTDSSTFKTNMLRYHGSTQIVSIMEMVSPYVQTPFSIHI